MIESLNLQEFELKFKEKKGTLIDVRTTGEFESGHLKNAIHMDWLGGHLHSNLDDLDKNDTYYLYCASGNRSRMAATFLKQQGFNNVYDIGGYAALAGAGL
ncbi:MAG TPA: rhodanese-like domain-containing protein [Bacteroidia bacterium]|nr:rhodanese-like domain-containing protein [Bacteroidia bacterium]